MTKLLKNISGIDYEDTSDEEVTLKRRMSKGVTDFKQKILIDLYGDIIDNSKKVLEIGCGCGRNAQYFTDNTKIKYFGFDSSPTSVKMFKDGNKYWNPNMKQCYVSTEIDKKILSQKYDFIFSMFTLNHIGFTSQPEVHDSESITKEMFPCLKNGGYWMSYELFRGQNAWNPDVWLEKSFNKHDIEIIHNKDVDLFDVDGVRLNDRHRLVVLRKK